MQPRIHVITLGVADLERALAFYRDGLGFDSPGVIGTEFVADEETAGGAAVMFQLQGGLILALYSRSDLAKDAGVPLGDSIGAFSLGHLVADRSSVDELLARAEAAGATVIGIPYDRPWGIYSGYFHDPDGHLWEVIWNPRADLDAS
jgi:catechol 2,3-dioxygenase-like lactoylglutathione lyase family enzyme